MNQELLKEITKDQIKADKANFKIGDGVRVHTKVREGDKERIQIFAGIVIARKGTANARQARFLFFMICSVEKLFFPL